jgi:flagellar hook-basal body complex protein FliE
MTVFPIPAVGAATPADTVQATSPSHRPGASFAQWLIDGLDNVSAKVAAADAKTQAFVLNDSVPVHQVTFALEGARDSMELMQLVRSRLVEAYQEFTRMQL